MINGITSSTVRFVPATVDAVEDIGQPRAVLQQDEPGALNARLLHEAKSGLASGMEAVNHQPNVLEAPVLPAQKEVIMGEVRSVFQFPALTREQLARVEREVVNREPGEEAAERYMRGRHHLSLGDKIAMTGVVVLGIACLLTMIRAFGG